MRALRRLKRRHLLLGVPVMLVLAWTLGIWPFAKSGKPPCTYNAETGQITGLPRDRCQIDPVAELTLFTETLCPGGDCEKAEENGDKVDRDGVSALRTLFDRLSPSWAVPKLFPRAQCLLVPQGQSVTMTWPAEKGRRTAVLSGRVAARRGNIRITLTTLCPGAVPPVRTVTRDYSGSTAPLAVAQRCRTQMTLTCTAGSCQAALYSTTPGSGPGSHDLASDCACQGNERDHRCP